MNQEEQAVLDFFAQQENLPLALSVAELVDTIRLRMNNQFWRQLGTRAEHLSPAWQVQLTEDRNTEDCIVGLSLQPASGENPLFLRPMLEQQLLGETPRIYFGLMWNSPPAPDRLALPEVAALRAALQQEGYKGSEKFLAWQWSAYHPRERRFLLRLAEAQDELLDEVARLLEQLLVTHGDLLQAANAALISAPRQAVVSLDTLRGSLKRPAN